MAEFDKETLKFGLAILALLIGSVVISVCAQHLKDIFNQD